MKNLFLKLSAYILILVCVSCGGSDDSTPEEKPEPEANPILNKTTTYVADVKTIIDTNCLECHSNPPTQQAPMPLTNFQEVVEAVNNRDLINRVSTTTTRIVMPQSGRLPQETVTLILDWDADGLKEN